MVPGSGVPAGVPFVPIGRHANDSLPTQAKSYPFVFSTWPVSKKSAGAPPFKGAYLKARAQWRQLR